MMLLRGSYSVAVQNEALEPTVEFAMLKLSVWPTAPVNVKLAFCPTTRLPVAGTFVAAPVVPMLGTVSVPAKSEALLIQKVAGALGTPLTVTMTGPVIVPLGTGTEIEPAAHDVGVAGIPLN